jgi:fructosamine-3-kinase
MVEGEHDDVLLLEHVENDGVFSPNAWADIGAVIARLHARTGERYGWPVDYKLGTVQLDNRQTGDWPFFWGEQRLAATASCSTGRGASGSSAWRRGWPTCFRRAAAGLLHGDLWTGNILVRAASSRR